MGIMLQQRRVTFNSELLDQPYRFQEFVIVHELLHLKIPNHGKLFKSLLKAYLPQRCYRRRGEGKAHEVYFHSEGLTPKQNRA